MQTVTASIQFLRNSTSERLCPHSHVTRGTAKWPCGTSLCLQLPSTERPGIRKLLISDLVQPRMAIGSHPGNWVNPIDVQYFALIRV
ncbi:rCG42550 [Rattus norvegicus]|uniref:RCG42550 n=1 Tax=Rattus norvegicus TaxID=10116 RepID=A6K1B7_RAT|nr:rCG42550 [Rattus norvegicus]